MSSSWTAALALDLRSLALLRALLGLSLLAQGLCDLSGPVLLHGDDGLLPRSASMTLLGPAQLSVHLLGGGAGFVALLLALQLLAALALLIGWHTRVAGALLLVLLISAAARNPLVTTVGDGLGIVLLLAGCGLPWNARWSVDAALAPAGTRLADARGFRVGAVLRALLLALPLLQTLAMAPDRPGLVELWLAASILPLGLFAHRLARLSALLLYLVLGLILPMLLHATPPPWMLVAAAATLLLDALAPRASTAPSPGVPLRLCVGDDDAAALRLSRLLCEFLGFGQAQVLAARDSPRAARLLQNGRRLVLLDRRDEAHLDGGALRALALQSPLLRPLRPLLGAVLGEAASAALLRALLRLAPRRGATPDRVAPRSERPVPGLALCLLLLLALAWHLAPQALAALRTPLAVLGLHLDWAEPARTPTQWIALVGQDADGREFDARLGPSAPARFVAAQHALLAGARGRAYERNLGAPGSEVARAALARHLCERHGPRMARVNVVLVSRSSPADAAVEQRVLLRHDCGAPVP